MSEDDRGIACSDEYTYWRRYLDEDAWETVGVDTVRLALADVYHDVSLAVEFLHEAGRIRTPAATYEATPIRSTEYGEVAQRSHTTPSPSRGWAASLWSFRGTERSARIIV